MLISASSSLSLFDLILGFWHILLETYRALELVKSLSHYESQSLKPNHYLSCCLQHQFNKNSTTFIMNTVIIYSSIIIQPLPRDGMAQQVLFFFALLLVSPKYIIQRLWQINNPNIVISILFSIPVTWILKQTHFKFTSNWSINHFWIQSISKKSSNTTWNCGLIYFVSK